MTTPRPCVAELRSRRASLPLLAAVLLSAASARPQDSQEIPKPVLDKLAEQQRRLEELERRLSVEAPPPLVGTQAPAKEIAVSSSTLRFYGFLRVDAIFDDSRPNNTQTIAFILSE